MTRTKLICACLMLATAGVLAAVAGEEHVVIIESGTYATPLRGVVQDQTKEPVSGARIEVFDHPEVVSTAGSYAQRSKQRKVATGVADDNGNFCLDLKPGSYELRISQPGFNLHSEIIKVKKGKATHPSLEIVLAVAT